jgi:CRP-like cAMP-binding protein
MRCFSKMHPLHVKPHDVIACSSDTKSSSQAASLYIIECGEVEATHVGLEQQQQVVERLSRGDFFGEIELLSVARRLLQEERDSQTAPPSPHKSGGGSEQTCSYVALTGTPHI